MNPVVIGAIVAAALAGAVFGRALPPTGADSECYLVLMRYTDQAGQPRTQLHVKYPGQWPRSGDIGSTQAAERDLCWGIQDIAPVVKAPAPSPAPVPTDE